MKNKLFVLATIFALSSCSSDETSKPVKGTSFFENNQTRLDKQSAELVTTDFFTRIPKEIKNDYWPRNGYVPGENLAFIGKNDYETKSIGNEAKRGFDISSTPVVSGGIIYSLGGQGELTARKIGDISEELWRVNIEEEYSQKNRKGGYVRAITGMLYDNEQFLGGNICYSLGNIYVATKRGYVFSVNAENGKINWAKNYNSQIRSSPVAREDKLAFVTQNNKTVVISTKDGSVIWEHQGLIERAKVMASPSPLIYGDDILVTYSSGEIYSFNFDSGKENWNTTISTSAFGKLSSYMKDISQNPIFHNGAIYLIASDGTLNALDKTGNIIWTFEGEAINKTPWAVEDFLFTITRFGEILAISAKTGKLIWKNKMAESDIIEDEEINFTGLIMANGKLYSADNKGTLYAYSAKDGETIETISIPDDIYLNPIIASGRIIFITEKSKLVELK
jgi:outer membrane protein assembly factor BamB